MAEIEYLKDWVRKEASKAEAAAKAAATAKNLYIPVPKKVVLPGALLGVGGSLYVGHRLGARSTEKLAQRREELFHSATEQDKRNMGRFALGAGLGIGSASVAAAIYFTMKKKAAQKALGTDPNKPVDGTTEL